MLKWDHHNHHFLYCLRSQQRIIIARARNNTITSIYSRSFQAVIWTVGALGGSLNVSRCSSHSFTHFPSSFLKLFLYNVCFHLAHFFSPAISYFYSFYHPPSTRSLPLPSWWLMELGNSTQSNVWPTVQDSLRERERERLVRRRRRRRRGVGIKWKERWKEGKERGSRESVSVWERRGGRKRERSVWEEEKERGREGSSAESHRLNSMHH